MNVLLFKNQEESAEYVAQEILGGIRRKPNLVLGLATGSTPIGVYVRLIHAHQILGVDFSECITFNLDEYLDLPEGHEHSFRYFMGQHFFSGVNLRPSNIHFPPSRGNDLTRKYLDYENKIKEVGGIDLQILGIGSNGHIGFNEPTSSLASRTRIKTLTAKTLRDNSRFFRPGELQPQMASTVGIGTILDARKILLQAFGAKKADAVQAAVERPISAFWPGSALQLHPHVTFCLDAESGSKLSLLDYYKRVRENEERLSKRDG
jgi:glucosamine-6-phosphate deaminase